MEKLGWYGSKSNVIVIALFCCCFLGVNKDDTFFQHTKENRKDGNNLFLFSLFSILNEQEKLN